jgi:hypothetical protein
MTEIVSKKPLNNNKNKLTFFDVDLCSPFKVKGLNDENLFITITDRKTRGIWIYPIKFKSQAFAILFEFFN